MLPVKLTILGVPKSKKNSRRNYGWTKGRRPVSLPSVEYAAWADSALLQVVAQWKGRGKITEPVTVIAEVYQGKGQAIDLGNSLEGAWDILETCGVLANDYQIKAMAPQLLRDRDNPRIELLILPFDQDRWDVACAALTSGDRVMLTASRERDGTEYTYDPMTKPAEY